MVDAFGKRALSLSFPLSVQAESALDQMDWIEKITGVIASLLSSQAPERVKCYLLCTYNPDITLVI